MAGSSGTKRTELYDRPSFLLSQLGFHSARRFTELLVPLEVHPRQYGMLRRLAASDGQSQQQLAAAMGIHRNVMVSLVDELERRGLVRRGRHPTDRRAHAVLLTSAGRRLLVRAEQIASEHNAELLDPLDSADQDTLASLLQRIVDGAGLARGVHPGLQAPPPQ
ncbi:MAG: MarR family transcriptional regulator [Pseudonocardiales bacterium]|nr:MAG: MarR family transcriptional regulator [Pseudonocardiales bacterium]